MSEGKRGRSSPQGDSLGPLLLLLEGQQATASTPQHRPHNRRGRSLGVFLGLWSEKFLFIGACLGLEVMAQLHQLAVLGIHFGRQILQGVVFPLQHLGNVFLSLAWIAGCLHALGHLFYLSSKVHHLCLKGAHQVDEEYLRSLVVPLKGHRDLLGPLRHLHMLCFLHHLPLQVGGVCLKLQVVTGYFC